MHVVTRQNTFDNMHTHFVAGLDDDFTDPLTHGSVQNLVAIFRDPHDVEPVVKSRMRG